MKPPLASVVLQQVSPRKVIRNTTNGSRFMPLRDTSVDSVSSQSTSRHRSVSVKKKLDYQQSQSLSYAFVASKGTLASVNQESFESLDTGIARVKSLSDKISTALSGNQIAGLLFRVLSDINSAICDLSNNQTLIAELLKR